MQLQQRNNVFYNVHTDKCKHFGWSLKKDTKKGHIQVESYESIGIQGTHTWIATHNFYKTTHSSRT